MGTKVTASLEFKAGFDGQLNLRQGSIGIGMADDQARPYDLLQGALVSCLHSTFLDILTKKRMDLPSENMTSKASNAIVSRPCWNRSQSL